MIQFETFRNIGNYEIRGLTREEPRAFNGDVEVVKYRITIEEVEEPKEVIASRLLKIWRECKNHHHHRPIKDTALKHGIELKNSDFGKDRKSNERK